MTEEILPLWRRPWVAVALCVTLLVLAIIPPVSHAIQHTDLWLEMQLNRAAGITPVFDQMLLFVADEDGRERLLGLVIIWFLFQLWRTEDRAVRARKLGTLMFIIVTMVAFFVIEDFMDDVVERRSPSYVIHPFRNIKQIHHWDVDIKDKRSFPSSEAMVLFMVGFTLLRLGQKKGGGVAMVAGLTLPLGKCITGGTWPTDIYLGSLPLAMLTTAFTVDTQFARLHGFLTDLAAAALDQSEKFFRDIRLIARERRHWWLSQRVFHMEVAVKRFASRELPKIMGCEDVKTRDIQLFVPLGGLKSIVRIATCGDWRAVLRAYPSSRQLEAEQHCSAARILEQHNIRAPRLLQFCGNNGKYGALFVIEEFVDGRAPDPENISHEDIEAIATELARLHSVKNRSWGPISLSRVEDFANVTLRRAEKQLSQACRCCAANNYASCSRDIEKWLRQWKTPLSELKEFSLVHGKLHRDNCVFELKSGRFCLLDNTTLEWGLPAVDLVQVCQSVFANNFSLTELFYGSYFSKINQDDVARVKRFVPLYSVLFEIAQIAKYAKREGRSPAKSNAAQKAETHWKILMDYVQRNP